MLLTPYAAGTALSVGSVLAALTSAFDLAVHAVNLGEHVFGPGLHLQVGQSIRVISCSVKSPICTPNSALRSAASLKRFWLMSTKVDRKMASSETIIVKS